jgi:PEGA domain
MNKNMSAPAPTLVLNLPSKGSRLRHTARSIFNFVAFVVIAAIAIPACLGYRINWEARTIQQTGLIELASDQQVLPMRVYINGKLQPESLPFRLNWAFSGNYDVRVERDEYQTWEKSVEVHQNMRSVFSHITLLFQSPKPLIPPKDATRASLENVRANRTDIQIQNGNELVLNGQYETSTSKDILDARWFPDGEHIVYQTGNALTLYDPSSKTTQNVITLHSKSAAPYDFQDGGRILIYADGDTVKSVELYEPVSLIGRLEAVRPTSTP